MAPYYLPEVGLKSKLGEVKKSKANSATESLVLTMAAAELIKAGVPLKASGNPPGLDLVLGNTATLNIGITKIIHSNSEQQPFIVAPQYQSDSKALQLAQEANEGIKPRAEVQVPEDARYVINPGYLAELPKATAADIAWILKRFKLPVPATILEGQDESMQEAGIYLEGYSPTTFLPRRGLTVGEADLLEDFYRYLNINSRPKELSKTKYRRALTLIEPDSFRPARNYFNRVVQVLDTCNEAHLGKLEDIYAHNYVALYESIKRLTASQTNTLQSANSLLLNGADIREAKKALNGLALGFVERSGPAVRIEQLKKISPFYPRTGALLKNEEQQLIDIANELQKKGVPMAQIYKELRFLHFLVQHRIVADTNIKGRLTKQEALAYNLKKGCSEQMQTRLSNQAGAVFSQAVL